MIESFLIGLAGGMRSMTPLAAVALAAREGRLRKDSGAPTMLFHPLAAAATTVMAAGEMVGDKLPFAPDRIIASGIAARAITGAIAGASLARRNERALGAALGAVGACLSAYLSFDARMRSMRYADQVSTGLVEDAVAIGVAASAVRLAAGI